MKADKLKNDHQKQDVASIVPLMKRIHNKNTTIKKPATHNKIQKKDIFKKLIIE